MSEGVWVLCGQTAIGLNGRLFGQTLAGPLRYRSPSSKMAALGCDRCSKRHSNKNTACAATFGIRVRRERGTVYNVKTGAELDGRYSAIVNPATGLVTLKRRE